MSKHTTIRRLFRASDRVYAQMQDGSYRLVTPKRLTGTEIEAHIKRLLGK